MIEEWKNIKGYENLYQVSNLGRVRSLNKKVRCRIGFRETRGKILKQHINYKGYKRISLSNGKKQENKAVHRLVAETFIPNLTKKPQVNHKDGNKLNNNVDNLEWVSVKENINHALKEDLSNQEYKSKKVIAISNSTKTEIIFNSIKEASEFFNVDRNIIARRLDKSKDYGGIYFKTKGGIL